MSQENQVTYCKKLHQFRIAVIQWNIDALFNYALGWVRERRMVAYQRHIQPMNCR